MKRFMKGIGRAYAEELQKVTNPLAESTAQLAETLAAWHTARQTEVVTVVSTPTGVTSMVESATDMQGVCQKWPCRLCKCEDMWQMAPKGVSILVSKYNLRVQEMLPFPLSV